MIKKIIKEFFKNLFASPKYVIYINVEHMDSDKVETYMKNIRSAVNIARTLYIPTRKSETRIEKL